MNASAGEDAQRIEPHALRSFHMEDNTPRSAPREDATQELGWARCPICDATVALSVSAPSPVLRVEVGPPWTVLSALQLDSLRVFKAAGVATTFKAPGNLWGAIYCD